MRSNKIGRASFGSFAWFKNLLADRRGSGDLTTYSLLTAAGAAMVAITVPSLFSSSNSAAQTFQNQVNVLERGAGGGGGAGGAAGGAGGSSGGWQFNVGPSGVSAAGPGGISASVGAGGASVGAGGGGGSVGGGGGGGGGGASGGTQIGNGANNPINNGANNPVNNGASSSINAQQTLLNAVVGN